jgi:hypothetical protein
MERLGSAIWRRPDYRRRGVKDVPGLLLTMSPTVQWLEGRPYRDEGCCTSNAKLIGEGLGALLTDRQPIMGEPLSKERNDRSVDRLGLFQSGEMAGFLNYNQGSIR